ncbi:DNA-binding MarR family transcriptional regulator [Catenuloplanes nepalensis]|uniref:DNA-binding MarR family transcriptional regulator n=1 Tax=Catenuloplanes nepalensis TaxID=587533 RepID=A0ABT9MMB7_9ACTN|nr:MarR family winged helix-turn-helix transcriptional regulator [Catenuloplanes nepalensis]MDP9792577.1 DNA-binding MarR family transcriptional regulator [Catenuloplanes nepalensis]
MHPSHHDTANTPRRNRGPAGPVPAPPGVPAPRQPAGYGQNTAPPYPPAPRTAGPRPTPRPGALVQLCRTASLIRSTIERTILREEKFTWNHFDALLVVCVSRGIEARRIAQEMGIAKATLTACLRTLIARGLIYRAPAEHDRRTIVLVPTDAGMWLATRLHTAVDDTQARILAGSGLPSGDLIAALLRELARRGRAHATTST